MNINKQNIFVFGSNLSGIHGAGAARVAHIKYGAVYNKGIGHYGNSYALPTKGHNISFMSLDEIQKHINHFINYAKANSDLTFIVTQVACGLAGYKPSRIAPLFYEAPKNCQFDLKWKPYLPEDFTYWGSY